jgi:hypothetical protein
MIFRETSYHVDVVKFNSIFSRITLYFPDADSFDLCLALQCRGFDAPKTPCSSCNHEANTLLVKSLNHPFPSSENLIDAVEEPGHAVPGLALS